MKLRTWLRLHELIERLDKPKMWRAFAYYIAGWCILGYFFGLFGSWYRFLIMFVAVMLVAKGLEGDLTRPCPAEGNCPFRDRLLKGYWEEKK